MVRLAAASCVIIAAVAAPSAATEAPAPASEGSEGALVIDRLDGEETVIGRRALSALVDPDTTVAATYTTSGGEFRLCFESDTPGTVQQLAADAVDRWAWALDLEGPTVEIDLHWLPFGSAQTLAAAGPGRFVVDDRLPLADTRYPVALANHLLLEDHTPREVCDLGQDPEIVVLVNSAAGGLEPLWHTGPLPVPSDRIDLASVLTHEIGHGLGFIGSAEADTDGTLAWPGDRGAPFVFDRFAVWCPDAVEVCSEPVPVSIGDVGRLTSNALWFDADDTTWKLFAPAEWNRGSSFAHLDETHYSDENALMTPQLAPGEARRTVDQAALAIVDRLGYPASAPLPPFGSETDFVQSVRSLVGRSADESALVAQARATDPLSTLAELFERAELRRQEQVARLYLGVLERSPDPEGLRFWSELAADERNMIVVADSFAMSAEFTRGRALGDEELVVRLYSTMLNRPPDPEGAVFWLSRLRQGAPPAEVVLTLSESAEHRRRADREAFIDVASLALVGRAPTNEERAGLQEAFDREGRPGVLGLLALSGGEGPAEE